MKPKNNIPETDKDQAKNITVLDLDLEKGASILCAPTGEQWRISAVEPDKISFEKLD